MLSRVLAIDDSTVALEMYRLFLSQYKGCQLVTATNGLEALDKLTQEGRIDLIILDINMPVMNGLEFLRRIRDEPLYKDIPVIIITTEGRDEDAIAALKMGASDYVKKPFQEIELHALIKKLAGGKQRTRKTEEPLAELAPGRRSQPLTAAWSLSSIGRY